MQIEVAIKYMATIKNTVAVSTVAQLCIASKSSIAGFSWEITSLLILFTMLSYKL